MAESPGVEAALISLGFAIYIKAMVKEVFDDFHTLLDVDVEPLPIKRTWQG